MKLTNLLNLLEEKNIKLSELARITGVPKSNLSAWLRGANPNLDQLDKVAQALGTTIEFLAFNRKDKNSERLIYRTVVDEGFYEISIKKIN